MSGVARQAPKALPYVSVSLALIVLVSLAFAGLGTASRPAAAPLSPVSLVAAHPSSQLVINATANVTYGDAPLLVGFNSFVSGGTPPYSYSWEFATGAASALASPVYQFQSAGTFPVSLFVNDSVGDSAMAQLGITVEPPGYQPLTLSISASPTSGSAPLTVNFEANPNGGSWAYTSYVWDFGDGSSSSTGANVSHTYTADGFYTISAEVTDSAGVTAQGNAEVEVGTPANLSVTLSASPDSGSAPLYVSFVSIVSGGDGSLTYAWFVDGTSLGVAGHDLNYTFGSNGMYTVGVLVTDALNDNSSATVAITVGGGSSPPPLTFSISASPVAGSAPLTTTFTATVDNGNGPYSYFWTFGDGTNSTGNPITHTFSVAGTYDVDCVVSNSTGSYGTGSTQVNVSATPSPPFTVQVAVSGYDGAAPFTATFTPMVNGGEAPYTLTWNFGDGSLPVTELGTASISHTYESAGDFEVSLQASDATDHVATWSTASSGGHGVSVSAKPTTSPLSVASLVPYVLLVVLIGAVVVWLGLNRRQNRTLPPTSGFSPPASGALASYQDYEVAAFPAPSQSAVVLPPEGDLNPTSPPAPPRDPLDDMV